MIISKQKKLEEILDILKEQDIFIIGCGKCATKLKIGGEAEVEEMKNLLKNKGKNIIGSGVLRSACICLSWEDIILKYPEIKKAKAILLMSCGGGVSVISQLADISIYPALDTDSVGGECCNETLKEQCKMCGECIVWMYGGICPNIKCAKSLMNGACGGGYDGKCEIDGRLCAWSLIFERLKKIGKLKYLEIVHEPRDYGVKLKR